MGAWASGLYSGDFAMDLRGTIGALLRLPFEIDRIVEMVCEAERRAATDPQNEDHTVFWLVLADQFVKRGIVNSGVRDRALAIIDDGSDLAMHSRLGIDPAGLKKRGKMLAELRARLAAPPPSNAKERSVLKHPQPFLMDIGDCFAYPTSGINCINSYYPSKEKIPGWKHDGWGAAVVIDRGRAFDFLTWYRALAIARPFAEKPSDAALFSGGPWVLKRPGTCSPVHFKRLELERIARIEIDRETLARAFPEMKPGLSAAISDISIANALGMMKEEPPAPEGPGKPVRGMYGTRILTIARLAEITGG
jgi:hypothetical protein